MNERDILWKIATTIEQVEHLLRKVYIEEERILHLLQVRLIQAEVRIVPKTVNVGGTAQAVIVGTWSDGQTHTLDSTYTVVYSASVPGDVTFGAVGADGSVTVTAVNADPGDQIGAAITRPDGTIITATPDTLTITSAPVTLVSAAVQLQ